MGEFQFENCYIIGCFQSEFVELAVLGLVATEWCFSQAGSWSGQGHPDLQNALCYRVVSSICSGCFSTCLT